MFSFQTSALVSLIILVSHGYGETCLHLILVFPVIELFRMKVINNGSASSVRDIVERRDQGGKWPLGSAVRLVMFRYVKIRHLIVDVLDNIMRNFSVIQTLKTFVRSLTSNK